MQTKKEGIELTAGIKLVKIDDSVICGMFLNIGEKFSCVGVIVDDYLT
jgi:hypothetical protein